MVAVDSLQDNVSLKDKSFLKLAQKCAQASSCEHRHGAVIVRGGSVLAIGINKWKNKPVVLERHQINNCSVHAEIDALSRVGNPKGATIYVARVNRKGFPRLSRPCDECYSKLTKAGIRRIVYTV
jgi:deoxycytidylate deaminase